MFLDFEERGVKAFVIALLCIANNKANLLRDALFGLFTY